MTRRTLLIILPVLSVLLFSIGVFIGRGVAAPASQESQFDSTFTYQGRLTGIDGPVTDTCDFRFSLFDADDVQVGSTLDRPEVAVVHGLFSVRLDFGRGAFDGGDRFLEIEVRCPAGGGIFTLLTPRQPLTPAPYAIFAYSSSWEGITNVPPEFADGADDDVLGGLACQHNQIPKWNFIADQWECAGVEDSVDDSVTFIASGAFTVPDGVRRIQVEVWGAGGGGGHHGDGILAGGGGGGGSGGYTRALVNVTPGESLDIVIGVGGAAGIEGSRNGVEGGASTVKRGSTVLASASGGKGGQGGQDSSGDLCSTATPGSGGTGGAGGAGDTKNGSKGGDGGSGVRVTFPTVRCSYGLAGRGGTPIEGSTKPPGSHGGDGGGAPSGINTQVPPAAGRDGHVLIRW